MAAAMPEPAMPCTSLRAESFGKLLRPETPGPGAADAVALETTRTRSPSYSFAKSARDNYKPSEYSALHSRGSAVTTCKSVCVVVHDMRELVHDWMSRQRAISEGRGCNDTTRL
jgi:hypothetical protein